VSHGLAGLQTAARVADQLVTKPLRGWSRNRVMALGNVGNHRYLKHSSNYLLPGFLLWGCLRVALTVHRQDFFTCINDYSLQLSVCCMSAASAIRNG
jgi:hypothetical protein